MAINRCADARNPRPRCARDLPLAINRSQRVGLINRALNYCISRHNNEVSSFRKKYGYHVGGRRGLSKSVQIIVYECVWLFFFCAHVSSRRHPRPRSRWKVSWKNKRWFRIAWLWWRCVRLQGSLSMVYFYDYSDYFDINISREQKKPFHFLNKTWTTLLS